MLEVNRLSRNYGRHKAVDDVTFAVAKGEIVGLLGHNGAGKTTIMKMISGYLEPDAGSVSVDGLNIDTHAKTIQQGLGYLPENLPVYPELSVADYLDYCADLKGLTGDDKIAEIKRALKATDITSKLSSPINTLSRGYKQRVGVAQAILGRPKLLVLDEPTNGLDPEQTQHMRELIRDIAKDATVILSTHIMQEVSALCSRVLILRTGQLVVDETLASLKNSRRLVLNTDMAEHDSDILRNLAGIDRLECIVDDAEIAGMAFRLFVNEQHDIAETTADLAKTLINHNHQIYRLTPEQQDLETLFRSVTEGQNTLAGAAANKEVSHAA